MFCGCSLLSLPACTPDANTPALPPLPLPTRRPSLAQDATPFGVRSLHADDFTSLPHLQPDVPVLCACKPYQQQYKAVRKLARGATLSPYSKLASLLDLPSRVDAAVLGAVGRLTALESLSIVADFKDNPGLHCLSSLVRLTSLELRYPLNSRKCECRPAWVSTKHGLDHAVHACTALCGAVHGGCLPWGT